MEQFTKDLERRLYRQLQEATLDSENPLQQAQRSFEIANAIGRALKEFLATYEFKDRSSEIEFFKSIKPAFQKELIYFEELYNLEANKPIGTEEAIKQYYSKVMERVKTYFENNRNLYNYHLSGASDLDEVYYLRQKEYRIMQPISALDMDPAFSTPYSSRLAKLLAFEQLRAYLNSAIEGSPILNNMENSAEQSEKNKLVWTDQLVDIMEIIIAMWTRGSVNYGKCTLKQLVTGMEGAFNVRISNSYQILKNMRMRKKERFAYLRKAIHSGEEKMDETDMNF